MQLTGVGTNHDDASRPKQGKGDESNITRVVANNAQNDETQGNKAGGNTNRCAVKATGHTSITSAVAGKLVQRHCKHLHDMIFCCIKLIRRRCSPNRYVAHGKSGRRGRCRGEHDRLGEDGRGIGRVWCAEGDGGHIPGDGMRKIEFKRALGVKERSFGSEE